MKKIIAISVVIIILVAIAILVIRGVTGNAGLAGSVPVQAGTTNEQRVNQITGGISSTDMPPGDTLTIGSPSGNVTVKNFYKSAVGIIEGTDVILAKDNNYTIDYIKGNGSFVITIDQGPIAAVQATAENQLLSILGVNQKDACRLSPSVAVPATLDKQIGGRSYPLSFCSPATP